MMKRSYKGMLAIELTITLGALKEKQIKFCKGSFIFYFIFFRSFFFRDFIALNSSVKGNFNKLD